MGADRRFPARLGRGLAALAFWCAVWAVLARRVGLTLLLPGPWAVARRLAALACTGEYWKTVGLSLLRVLLGFLSGAAAGMVLAALTCRFRAADTLLSPAIWVVRAAPVASFILLAQLWLQSGILPGVIAGLMVLPVVWQNTAAGIRATDRQLLEMAKVFRFGRWRTLRLVYVPSVAPHLRAAWVTGLGLAWKSGVAAEVLSAPAQAVGREMANAKIYLETPDLFAWTVTVIVLSMAMERVLKLALKKLPGGVEI